MVVIHEMIDGFDVPVVLSNGTPMVLHFVKRPTEQQIEEAKAQYESSIISQQQEQVIEIECEDGAIV